jgi:curli biogenesis system outer membrane secretion channel CsgG
MKLRSICASMVALLLVAATLSPLPARAGDKRRVAILPFSYGAVESSVGTCDVGKGITSLLITKLVQDGTYSVVDREMLDNILKEQNLSVSDRADPSTACKIGKILSVDAIVTGTVTQFGVEKKSSSFSVPSVGGYGIPYVGGLGSLGSFHSNKAKAKVGIDARLIDINTTEVLATANGTGMSSKGGWSLNSTWDFCGSDFASSIAGEATLAAVDQLIGQLTSASAKIPDNQSLAAANVQGKIADVTGNQVVVNVGKKNGVKVGDNLQVERVTKTIKDPNSGRVIKEVSSTIGIVNIVETDSDSATGNVAKGGGLRVGDVVKKVTTDVSAIVITPLGSGSGNTATTATPPATRPTAH